MANPTPYSYKASRDGRAGWTMRTAPGDRDIHCNGTADRSPTHTHGMGYDSRCSYCYLGIPHTSDLHRARLEDPQNADR